MKIILAVDLYDETERDPLIYDELSKWCSDVKTDVQPVFIHVSSPEVDVFTNQMVQPRVDYAALLKPFADLKIIHTPIITRKKEIEELLAYAKEQNADLIALISQGKSGLEKKLLGSFAETLLLKSEIPLLFLEEEVSSREKVNKILFATDFSEASKKGFHILLNHVKLQKPEIVIFNAIPLPQFSAAGHVYAQALNVLPQRYWDEQRKWAEDKGDEFQNIALKMGLSTRIEIANQVYSIENAVHEVVRREKVKLIAMVSVSQPLQRFLIGSVSRTILRTRIKPIWICGPQSLDLKD